jgi:putative sigma-54 modulation protein
MKLQMSAQQFTADSKLLDLIQKKANKLDLFFDKIIDGEVFLRLENDETKENKIIEMKLNVPGTTLFVKEKGKTFEVAADGAVDALRKQLGKYKGKLIAA